MIVDADAGQPSIGTLLHQTPKHNIQQLLDDGMSLKDVIVEDPRGIQIIAACSRVQEPAALNELQKMKLLEAFGAFSGEIDILLIDTAACLSENAAFFCIAAQEIVIVTSPEQAAVTDACTLIEALYIRYREKEFQVLVNSAKNAGEAVEVFRSLVLASEKFPSVSLDYLGYLPHGGSARNAARAKRSLIEGDPRHPASKRIGEIAKRLLDSPEKVKGTLQFFIGDLLTQAAGVAR
jgi:flagellar biosynthesis protein FlhG